MSTNQFVGKLNYGGSAFQKHGFDSTPRLQFTLFNRTLPSEVIFSGRKYPVTFRESNGDGQDSGRISGLPFLKTAAKGDEYDFHVTPTGRLVLDSKRAASRQIRRAKERETKELTDACLRETTKRKHHGKRVLSTEPRKPSDALEEKLVRRCVAFAKSLGVVVLPMDKDGYPDKLFLLGTTLLGAVEFKSPTGTPDPDQRKRIKQLREVWGVDRMPTPMRLFATFKAWLLNRITTAKAV